ncbi:hypothetical protein V2J09_019480 [Rumex salicifolius]
MEIVYLLLSAISTFITSVTQSLLLPFQLILRRYRSPISTATASEELLPPVSYYEGVVWHDRRRPVRHSFSYRVRYALFDLDHSLHTPPDHLSADKAREVAGTSGPVLLLTIPPSVGYVQNPLSLYYCYELDGSNQHLKKCIAEVTNTPWGERVVFDFDPGSDLVAKSLHVSPFMDMLGSWTMKVNSPGDDLSVSIMVQHPDLGSYFTATLRAKRIPASMVSDQTLYFWLMPHKVALWIYWHALKLWWKGVPFVQHPRYSNQGYREEAISRDQNLRCCILDKAEPSSTLQCSKIADQVKPHGFTWRDANWPWC